MAPGSHWPRLPRWYEGKTMRKQALCHPLEAHAARNLCWKCYVKTRDPIRKKSNAQAYYKRHRERLIAASKQRYATRDKEQHSEADRNRNLLKSFGITPEEYAKLLELQEGRCSICRRENPGGRWPGRLAVDHEHESSKVR